MKTVKILAAALPVMLSCASVSAAPYWIFFAEAPAWSAGDPVPAELVSRVASAGADIRTISRYFNAVSAEFEGDPASLEGIPGVREVRPVRTISLRDPVENAAPVIEKPAAVDSSGYGAMLDEIESLNILPLHERGLSGDGVLIGVLDSGFDYREDTGCLKNIKVIGTRNFITGGTDVSGDDHGSLVLACIAGLENGYRAPATGASFLLAVTEKVATETRADEDRWVAGLEWCDSLGADIVSSSLVYNEFDTIEESYTKEQMDGRTSLVAQAAEIAVSRGVMVVNSAGNEGNLPWRIVTTPGDAERVLAVGAVDIVTGGDPVIASFSSRGPTADGRTKPDVVAPGVEVSMPVLGFSGFYATHSGTSFAAPLVSGLCALLIEAHPECTPSMIMEAIRDSARDLGDIGPDNDYGWGIPDGLAALDVFPSSAESGASEAAPVPFALRSPFPNPFNPAVTIPFRLSGTARVRIAVYDVTGRLVATLADGPMSAGEHSVVWNARDCASGVYLVRAVSGGRTDAKKAVLVK